MIAKAEGKYIRISPTKVRPVIELVKGESAQSAVVKLELINKRGAYHLKRVISSAIANAKNKGYQENQVFISKIIANPGPVLKRYRAASFGKATTIKKRTSHILVELDSSEKIIQKAK
ncbi:MAG: 50S ribosomal protein L22 [Candidatus Omnitrophota bacterium]